MNRTAINTQVNNRYRAGNRPFYGGWWGRPGRPGYRPPRWHRWYYRPGNWWRWASAAAVTSWITYGWGQPIYYSYGSGGNVYYEDNSVYVDGQPTYTAEEYYDQAEQIATAVPELTDEQAENIEWMSLGVFAITQEGSDQTNRLLQLAVSKDGIIGGTYYNESTGASHPVEGTVDKQTQRAAWRFIDGSNQDVVFETGIYNLTENECEALVHYGAEKTQTVVLVRLDEPQESQTTQTTGNQPPQ